jgi:hypothetical protein
MTQVGGSRGGGGDGRKTVTGGWEESGWYQGGDGDSSFSLPSSPRPYDPLSQRPPSKNINNQLSMFGDASASRVNTYGKPNMGGQRFSRRNEMPTRDDWYN